MGEDTRAIEQQIEDTRERMGDTVAALSHKADVPGRMKESMAEKKQTVTDKLTSAKESVIGSAGGAASTAQDGSRRAVGMAQDNPLGLAIGAAAVGFVVGSLLPATRVEQERIGPLADQVSDVASEAVEHGKQVAQDAAEAATGAAKESGQEHAEQLRESAQETVSS